MSTEAGWLAIPAFLSADDVASVTAVCAELLALPAPERAARDKVAAGTRHLFALDERSDVIDGILHRPALQEAVAGFLGSTYVTSMVSYRCPQPTFGGQKLHADDMPKLHGGPATVATAIIALTEFTATNGSTRVVPGSHLRPDLQRHSGSLETHPDEIMLTGPAGAAFVFTGHLLHSGTVNTSTDERPALQLTWRRR